ncbi:MAG: HupE/UreJ family protein [Thiogranum sp.]|nr:HupE/UreJ family protein [Thiogranum sp.]
MTNNIPAFLTSLLLTLVAHPLSAHTLTGIPVHSHADGSAMTIGASPLLYLAGYVFVTLMLHVVSRAFGRPLFPDSRTGVVRAGGLGLAGAGIWLLATL